MTNTEDMIEVVRILRYRGPRSEIERTLQNSVQGTKKWGSCSIDAVTIGSFPEILGDYAPKEIKRSSAEWQFLLPSVYITDPDGWDRRSAEKFTESWMEPITEEEYIHRRNKSTTTHRK